MVQKYLHHLYFCGALHPEETEKERLDQYMVRLGIKRQTLQHK